MTPKNKANELVLKYIELVRGSLIYETYLTKAKNCALIAVDEILDLGYTNKSDFKVYDFYSKVKLELLKK